MRMDAPDAVVEDAKDSPSEESAGESGSPGREWRRWFRAIPWLLTLAALVHPIARGVARHLWIADLVCHLQEPALAATVLATLSHLRSRRWLSAGLLVLAAYQTWPLLRYSGVNPVPPDPASNERVRFVSMNLLFDNVMYEDAIHLIETEKPDVIGFVEYTPSWYIALSPLHREYPYRIDALGGAEGLALWFRKPPKTLEPPLWLSPGGWPTLHATFEFGGKTTHVWLVHPRSPLKKERRHAGFPELDAIAERIGSTPDSRIVLGDFNTTEGSPHFQDFERVSGLRDTRLGFGRQPSWPTMTLYQIPIDHAFVSNDLAVVDRHLGHMVGSDHFPVVLELAPAASNEINVSAPSSPSADSP